MFKEYCNIGNDYFTDEEVDLTPDQFGSSSDSCIDNVGNFPTVMMVDTSSESSFSGFSESSFSSFSESSFSDLTESSSSESFSDASNKALFSEPCKMCIFEEELERCAVRNEGDVHFLTYPSDLRVEVTRESRSDSIESSESSKHVIDELYRLTPEVADDLQSFEIGPSNMSIRGSVGGLENDVSQCNEMIGDMPCKIDFNNVVDWQVSAFEDSDTETVTPYNPDFRRETVEDRFVGFGPNSVLNNNMARLNRIRHDSFSNISLQNEGNMTRRHTRSRGPVMDLPNVQDKLLERKRKS